MRGVELVGVRCAFPCWTVALTAGGEGKRHGMPPVRMRLAAVHAGFSDILPSSNGRFISTCQV